MMHFQSEFIKLALLLQLPLNMNECTSSHPKLLQFYCKIYCSCASIAEYEWVNQCLNFMCNRCERCASQKSAAHYMFWVEKWRPPFELYARCSRQDKDTAQHETVLILWDHFGLVCEWTASGKQCEKVMNEEWTFNQLWKYQLLHNVELNL